MTDDPLYDLFIKDEWAKWLHHDLKADKVKQLRGKRCSCGFFLAEINRQHICAYCLGNKVSRGWDRNIVKHTVLYGPYGGRTHFWVLANDFEYCRAQFLYRASKEYESSKLTHLFELIQSSEGA